MALDIRHDATMHTNGRLGMFFAQTEVEVWEVKELSGNVEVDDTLSGNVEVTPAALTGSVQVEANLGP
jgi:hypothetical protein